MPQENNYIDFDIFKLDFDILCSLKNNAITIC